MNLQILLKHLEENLVFQQLCLWQLQQLQLPAAAAAAAEEKAEYKVTLKDAGAEKIKVIKALRAVIPDLNLTDAKKAVEEAPSVIAESASKA